MLKPPVFIADYAACGGPSIELSADESRHAVKVLRLSRADTVIVIDGAGTAYRGEIASIGHGPKVTINVRDILRNFGEPRLHLTLAAALSVGEKLDMVIQMATELGIKRIVLIESEKSKMQLDDPRRLKSRLNRWRRVALASAKQCRRSFVPEVSVPVSVASFVRELESGTLGLVFHPSRKAEMLDKFGPIEGYSRISLLIGPESGFSDDEVDIALAAGFRLVSMGSRILRSQTAGPIACALTMYLAGELS
ncbi:MAG: RsmE family RNA methyltransferase [Candidatus Zixiibacteriota bacterium]